MLDSLDIDDAELMLDIDDSELSELSLLDESLEDDSLLTLDSDDNDE
jgi:hypothetical protein